MTLAKVERSHPAREARATAHAACDVIDRFGWSVCVTSGGDGLGLLVRSRDRVRLLIGEPAIRCPHPSIDRQLQTVAAKLLSVRCPAADSVDVLCRFMNRQLGNDLLPGPSLTVIDLHKSGQVQLACRVSPPVLVLSAFDRPGSPRCAGSDGDSDMDHFQSLPGDYLVAFSPRAVRSLSSERLATLPNRVADSRGPCALSDELLDSVGDRHETAPPMALVRRTCAMK
ncbi:hypothetical protein JOD67_006934 [Tenggerimyces flavus]|nr:hypothetical protein [Tenggerimyces flavus]